MCGRILCKGIVNIIGCHKLHIQLFTQPQKGLIYRLLSHNSMVLKLQKEIPPPENLLILKSCLFSLLIQPPLQIALNFSGQASAEADNSFMVLFKDLIIHPGPVIESVHKPFGHNLNQILIPC